MESFTNIGGGARTGPSTVLVTGAGGFIGGYVVREFVARGWRVVASVHRHIPGWLKDMEAAGTVRRVTVDLGDARQAAALAEGIDMGCDAVIHCAGRASDVGWRREFRRANLESVQHVVRLVAARNVRRFVFLSTTDVYGLHDFQGEAEEALPLGAFPPNPYPEFKIEAEQWIRKNLAPERFTVLRLAQVWGAGDTTLTARIVDFLRVSPWIVHFGKWRGQNRWPLAHVRNVARACFLAATTPAAGGRALNVLDDERTSMDEWYGLLAGVYLPGRTFRRLFLSLWPGRMLGRCVTLVSNAFNMAHPFMDPSHYAVHAVSANLDFGNERYRTLLREAGERAFTREEGMAELQRAGVSGLT